MSTLEAVKASHDEKGIFIKMVLDAWKTQNSRVSKLLNELSDEQLSAETAPGKNTGLYLIGHLTAVSDGLLPLLGYGERLYPQYEEIFLKNPDKSGEQPSIGEVRKAWIEIASRLEERFGQITQDEWLEKHTAVSDEDFAKEPHRNRLNVLIGRTNHQSYHLGQLGLLGNKEEN